MRNDSKIYRVANRVKGKLDASSAAGFATAAQGVKADNALPASAASNFATAAQGVKADNALPASSYTAADILAKLLTVDGTGSGLDADTLRGSADYLPLSGGTLTGNLTINRLSGEANLYLDTPTAQHKGLRFLTNGKDRWILRATNAVESGSNAGTNFHLLAMDDGGSYVLSPVLTAIRATGYLGVNTLSPEERFDVNGISRAQSLVADGDAGGTSGCTTLTNGTAGVSSGTGTVKMNGTTSRNSAGWLKLYVGTTAVYVPYWTTITG